MLLRGNTAECLTFLSDARSYLRTAPVYYGLIISPVSGKVNRIRIFITNKTPTQKTHTSGSDSR